MTINRLHRLVRRRRLQRLRASRRNGGLGLGSFVGDIYGEIGGNKS